MAIPDRCGSRPYASRVAGGVDAARQFPGRFHVDRDAHRHNPAGDAWGADCQWHAPRLAVLEQCGTQIRRQRRCHAGAKFLSPDHRSDSASLRNRRSARHDHRFLGRAGHADADGAATGDAVCRCSGCRNVSMSHNMAAIATCSCACGSIRRCPPLHQIPLRCLRACHRFALPISAPPLLARLRPGRTTGSTAAGCRI